jgi:membrane protease YdiL (CAAX protease family)
MNITIVKSLFDEFIAFLRLPKHRSQQNLTRIERLRNTSILFVFDFVMSILLVFFIFFLESTKIIPEVARNDYDWEKVLWKSLLIGAIILPFFEELFFRSWISRLRYALMFVGFVGCMASFFYFLNATSVIVESCLVSIFIFCFIFIEKSKTLVTTSNTTLYNEKLFNWVFYTSSFLVFGLMHISNFETQNTPYWVYPIMTLPQLFSGLTFGFVRCRYGFWYAVFIHFFNNFVAINLEFLFP